MLFPKMKKKTREKVNRAFLWFFLAVFVFSVAAAAVITLATPATPPGH